jgi:hypothetical protein
VRYRVGHQSWTKMDGDRVARLAWGVCSLSFWVKNAVDFFFARKHTFITYRLCTTENPPHPQRGRGSKHYFTGNWQNKLTHVKYIRSVDNDCYQEFTYILLSNCFRNILFPERQYSFMYVFNVQYVHFQNILVPERQITFMYVDYICSMYISGGGGAYK